MEDAETTRERQCQPLSGQYCHYAKRVCRNHPRWLLIIFVFIVNALAPEAASARQALGELVAAANDVSDKDSQTAALYELRDRFPSEPQAVDLFVRIASDTNTSFLNCLLAIQGLKLSGNREAATLAAMQMIMQRTSSKSEDDAEEKTLQAEAIQTIGVIGPSAYPVAGILIAVVTNSKASPSLRMEAARALSKIGSAAQATIPGLEEVFISDQEDKQLRLAVIQAVASVGPSSSAVFEKLCDLIVSQPQSTYELDILANAFAQLGAGFVSNRLDSLDACNLRRLDERADKAARFIRSHAQALQNAPITEIDNLIAKLDAESERRPCSSSSAAVSLAAGVVLLAAVLWFIAKHKGKTSIEAKNLGKLPPPSNPPQKMDYEESHKKTLAAALVRLGLLAPDADLPKPYDRTSGVLNKSVVYFLFIPRNGSGITLVAKFDELERFKREWEAIKELQCINTAPEVILPFGKNEPQDEVIIYKGADGATSSGNVIDMRKLLVRQLMHNPENCIGALEKTFMVLNLFYDAEPGSRFNDEDQVLHWSDVFPNIEKNLENIFKTVQKEWPKVNWLERTWDLPGNNGISGMNLPNPFFVDADSGKMEIQKRLDDLTRPVMLSRVHGDLNLTNILVNLDPQHCPGSIFIIDLSHCEKNKVTAADFARMESEFWHEPIVALKNEDLEDRTPNQILQTFASVRDCLDGRLEQLPVTASQLERHSLRFVCHLRENAVNSLRGNQRKYSLYDYFACLFFRHIGALAFPSVKKEQLKVRMAVLGAALALQVIEEMEAGRYGEGATERRRSLVRPCKDMLPKATKQKKQGMTHV